MQAAPDGRRPSRRRSYLPLLGVTAALIACKIDAVTFVELEDCAIAGDEDGNGLADCDDPACAGAPECPPVRGCGDGVLEAGERCDDGNRDPLDGCSPTCEIDVICGDGLIVPTEQCDDGNLAPGDGCSASCAVEFVNEAEPNGTTAEATASPLQITGDRAIHGSLNLGQDFYRLTVTTATVVRFETFTSFFDCDATTLDLQLLSSTGALILSDTSGHGVAGCGALTFFLAPGTYFARVQELGNDVAVPSYFLVVDYETDRGMESEPAGVMGANDTLATAQPNLTSSPEASLLGDHSLATDTDVYAITVPGGARVRAEITEGNRALETCESGGIDSRLTLLDAAGNQLADADDNGRGKCSLIDGTGAAPLHAAARNSLTRPQTFFLMVRASAAAAGGAAQFAYRLSVSIR